MSSTWNIEGNAQRLQVSLYGRFEVEHARQLEAELHDGLLETPRELLILLDELDELTRDARMHLAEIQRWLAQAALRTAYVSNRALFRGVALWIVHTSDDFNARSFSSASQAEQWFRSRDERPDLLRRRALRSLRLIKGGGGGS